MNAPAHPLVIKAAMRSADVGHLAEQIHRLERGGIDALHFDVMDGRFVPEIYLGPLFIRELRPYTNLPFEVHLLVEEPDAYVRQYLEAGANGVLIHLETSADPEGVLAQIRQHGAQAGLAIAPKTSAEALAPYLHACDLINIMTVTPGAPGKLDQRGVENLSAVARMIAQGTEQPLLQADGAVSLATRDCLREAGAQALIAGYPIFSSQEFGEAITQLRHGQVIAPSCSCSR